MEQFPTSLVGWFPPWFALPIHVCISKCSHSLEIRYLPYRRESFPLGWK